MRKFFNKRNKDRASATLVTGIISFMFLALCMGTALDISKNSFLSGSFKTRAQQASQASLKTLDARGGLKSTAANSFVTEYINDGIGDESKYFSSNTGQCRTMDVDGWDGKTVSNAKLPYIVIKFDTDRKVGNTSGGPVYVSTNGDTPKLVSGKFDVATKYTVINAKVTDAAPNFMLGMFGVPCQKFSPNVSSITFGSTQDLK